MDFSFIRVLSASVRLTLSNAKKDAKRLQKAAPEVFGTSYPLSACQEAYARARGFRHWHELETVSASMAGPGKGPFWKLTGRSDVHESVLRALLQSELEMSENGPVVFLGNSEDGVLPALCLWAEQMSAAQIPGLMLIDTAAASVQDSVLWPAVRQLELERLIDEYRVIDTRDTSVPLAISALPRCWVRSLLSVVPKDVAERLESSGFRHLLEKCLSASAAKRGDADSEVFISDVEDALIALSAKHPNVPGALRPMEGEDSDLQYAFQRYGSGLHQPDAMAVREIFNRFADKGLRLGRVYSSETPHRPAIALIDSTDPASLLLAALIHAQFYWRYVGVERRQQGIQTRPIMYLSERPGSDIARFIVESHAGYTCLATGGSADTAVVMPAYLSKYSRFVTVENNSFVYSGRRVTFKPQQADTSRGAVRA